MIVTPLALRFLYCHRPVVVGGGRDGGCQSQLFGQCLGVHEPDPAAFLLTEPGILGLDDPVPLAHVEHVRTQGRDAIEEGAVQSLNRGAHQRHGDNPDHDAQRGEHRAHLVGADRVPGDSETLADFGEEGHPPAQPIHGDTGLAMRSDEGGAARPVNGASDCHSSLAIRPSRMRMMRRACLAMSSSWVTTMIVLPLLRQFREQGHDLGAGLGVEVPGRLIGQQDGGPVDQRAGDGNALALAAGELVGFVMNAVSQADLGERLERDLAALVRRHAGVNERQFDVVQRVGARQQVERLKHEPDLAIADFGQLVVVHLADVGAVQLVAAGGGRVEAADDVHQAWICRSRTAP